MTRAPWLLQNGRSGYRMGMPSDTDVRRDGARTACGAPIGDYHMGLTAENLSERFDISKELQNDVAYRSQLNASSGHQGRPLQGRDRARRRSRSARATPRSSTRTSARARPRLRSLAGLKPVFKRDGGVVTAGNASAISDGASAVVVTSRKKAAELGLKPIAQLVSYATAAVRARRSWATARRVAAQNALEKAGLTSKDVQLAELNEAFACVAALATRELGLDPDIVNVNGGAVALGHPLGNTGTRMIVTLIHELQKRGQEIGLTGACVGGGQGAGSRHQGRGLITHHDTTPDAAGRGGAAHAAPRPATHRREGEAR